MGMESVRGYVQMASGLGEIARGRAVEAMRDLLAKAGVDESTGRMTEQVAGLAEDLLDAAMANRESIIALVRTEAESAVTRLGLVPAQDLEEARDEVARLRAELASLQAAQPTVAGGPAGEPVTAGVRPVPSSAPTLPDLEPPAPARVGAGADLADALDAPVPATAPVTSPSPRRVPVKKASPPRTSAKKASPSPVKKAAAKKVPATTKAAPRKASAGAAAGVSRADPATVSGPEPQAATGKRASARRSAGRPAAAGPGPEGGRPGSARSAEEEGPHAAVTTRQTGRDIT